MAIKLNVNGIPLVKESVGVLQVQTISIGGTSEAPLYADIYTKEGADILLSAKDGSYARITNAASSGTVVLPYNTLTIFTTVQNATTMALTLPTEIIGRTSEARCLIVNGNTPIVLTYPAGITWAGGVTQAMLANKTYNLSFEYQSATVIVARGEEI